MATTVPGAACRVPGGEAEAAAARWLRPLSAAEAEERIGDWYRRGYALWSDPQTHSTHLRRVEPCERGAAHG